MKSFLSYITKLDRSRVSKQPYLSIALVASRWNSRSAVFWRSLLTKNTSTPNQKHQFVRLFFLALCTTCLSEQMMPKSALAWTTSADEAGWYADAGFPSGAPVNNNLPYISNAPSSFSTIGGMLSGSGLTLSHTTHTLSGSTYTVFQEANVAALNYASAVTNAEYIYSSLTVSASSPSVRISGYRFNQMQMDSARNATGAQMVLALYDVTAGTLTQISNQATLRGSTTGFAMPITASPVLLPGKTYELRQYFYSSTGSPIANYYLDNPTFQIQENQAPTAATDSFSTTTTSSATISPLTNDTDPENDTRTITQINGTNIAVGGSVSVTGGTVTLNSGGTLTYVPNSGYTGSPSFNYTISDGNNNTATGTVNGTVTTPPIGISGTVSCNNIYGITSDATNILLKTFDPTNGTTTTVATMGPASSNAYTLGIDTVSGRAYYVANAGTAKYHIFSYDPITNIATDTGAVVAVPSNNAVLELGFDQTGLGYIIDQGFNAWSFTTASTPVITSLGVVSGMANYNGGDIAFDSNNVGWTVSRNTLAGATNGNYTLFRVIRTGNTLAATIVGDLKEGGVTLSNGANIGSVAFDPAGNLYIVRSSDGHSWKIDPKTAIATTIASSIVNNGNGISDFATCAIPTIALASSISGTVFEDVDYGGGAGRKLTAAAGVVRPGVRVELYNSTGAFKGFDTTDAAGLYIFDSTNVAGGVIAGDYTVRVVNSLVTSSRPGSVAGLLPVQTYRTNASTGTAIADPNRVGGEVPSKVDAGNGSTTLASLTTGTTTAESIASVKIIGTNGVASVDFGYNFDTIINTNDSGQGSLRQFITNSNALTNAGLDQVANSSPAPGTTAIDPTAGQETSIFMINDGTGRPGLPTNSSLNLLTGGLASLTLNSTLPRITDSNTSVDARTQTINVGNTNAGLLGQAITVSGTVGVGGQAISDVAAPEVSLALNNLPSDVTLYVGSAGGATVNNTLIAGLALISKNNDYRGQLVVNASNNTTITDNTFGVSTSLTNPGTAAQSGQSIDLSESDTAQTISNVTIKNNLFAYVGFNGVRASFFNAGNVKVNGLLVQSNQFLSVGARSNGPQINGECMVFSGQVNNVKVLGNLFKQCGGTVGDNAIELFLNTGSATGNGGQPDILLQNNTLQDNQGVGITIASINPVPNPAITIDRNIISGTKADSATAGGNAIENTLTGVTITQNSLFDNDKLGIDLGVALGGIIVGTGGVFGVNANDGTATLIDANKGMDYPIITGSNLSGTGTLTVTGFVGNNPAGSANFANAKLEFFIADNTPANQNGEVILGDGKSKPHGEGKTYIGNCTADAIGKFNCSFANAGTLGVTDPKNITSTATDPTGNTSEFSSVPNNQANILMVKRVTAINGNSAKNPNDNTPLNLVVDDTSANTTAPNDNNCNWPGATGTAGACTNTYTKGALAPGKVKPGDEIEYTIYYLNAGENRATTRVCDQLDPNLTFQTQGGSGIGWSKGTAAMLSLTNTGTDADKGQLTNASVTNCNLPSNGGTEVVAVDVGDATNPVFGATGAGAPTTSYGYIRFKALVK